MRCVSVHILLILSLSIGSVGCVYQGRLSIRRVWADFNTLNEPALFYEKIDHFPYHAAKVDHFRWMYNQGPNPRVPYQVIPEGALEESIHPQSKIPAWDCPTCITPDAVRPSMMSNQPAGFPSDEKSENERRSPLSRMNRWLLGDKKRN